MRLSCILFAIAAMPFVLASQSGSSDSSECAASEFKWAAKSCCLPVGGPSTPESPPQGSTCPSNWSWKSDKGCCAPHQPPQSLPPPQCSSGWGWSSATYCCRPSSGSSTTTTTSKPSATPGTSGNGGSTYPSKKQDKRHHRARSVNFCPQGLAACPVSSLTGFDFECVDTFSDLDNCGGCAISGEGQNCNTITGAWNVGCEQGACKIYTCAQGYKLSRDRMSCVPL